MMILTLYGLLFISFVNSRAIDQIILDASHTSNDENSPEHRSTIDELIQNASLANEGRDVRSTGGILTEGDMILTNSQYNLLHGNTTVRNALRQTYYRWPGNVVHYYIQSDRFEISEINLIKTAVNEWESLTCLDFQEKQDCSSINDCIIVTNGTGCQSYVGRIGGHQTLKLAKGCMYHSVIMHELGHAIGFHHEQTRPDRDSYITVYLENVKDGLENNFDKYSNQRVYDFVSYDYYSVMHYGKYAFTKNGKPTLVPKDSKYDSIIGNARTVSFGDVKMTNIMYNCKPNSCNKVCPDNGYPDKNCNCMCPGSPIQACSGTTATMTTTTTTTTTTTVAPPISSSCIDRNRYCWYYHIKGFCKQQSNYFASMLMYCRKTCKFCNLPCQDFQSYCAFYTRLGLCNYSAYYRLLMSSVCPRSCKLCQG